MKIAEALENRNDKYYLHPEEWNVNVRWVIHASLVSGSKVELVYIIMMTRLIHNKNMG